MVDGFRDIYDKGKVLNHEIEQEQTHSKDTEGLNLMD